MSTPVSEVKISTEWRTLRQRLMEVGRLVAADHKRALVLAALLMAAGGASSTIIAMALGKLVDGVSEGRHAAGEPTVIYGLAIRCLGVIAGVYILREAINVARRYLVENTCTRINRDTTLRLLAHVTKTNLQSLSQSRLGALHGRINRSVDGLVRFLRISFLDFFPALFTGMIALIAAVNKSWLLGLAMIGVIPIAVFLTIRQIASQKGTRLALMRDCEEIDGAIVEQLAGIEYLRAGNTHDLELERFAAAAEKRRAREIRHHFEMSIYGGLKSLNEGAFHVLVLGASIYLAILGSISPGDVLVFSVLFLNVMAPLGEVHRILDEGHEASLRVGDLLDLLAEPIDHSFEVPNREEPRRVTGEPIIEFADLVAQYQNAAGKLVRALDRVSLTIRHGETIGIAGPSGCGKSTWVKIVLRLTHPHEGEVRLGGVPLDRVGRDEIAKLIGYVGQQPFIFSGTIADNIAYPNKNAKLEDIRRAAELANLHDEIEQMPGGYQAPVTERGQNLSGGQRQRLAIARVLYKQPPVLILDEATSALDNISERFVQRALGVRDPDRTTILIAHRLSTLRDADRIIVFNSGRVEEIGPYEDLLARQGTFAALVASAEKGLTVDQAPLQMSC